MKKRANVCECLSGLDHCSGRIWCFLLQRRMQLPPQCAHERNQSRHRTDFSSFNESDRSAQTVLRADQVDANQCLVLFRRLQRYS